VAGVADVIAVCPRPEPVVMAAALEAGVTRLFHVGGAHAIAAMAYGTDTIPRVDKIVGPGNRYVAAAKALVSAECAIDFYAGPTEIVVVAARTPGMVRRGPSSSPPADARNGTPRTWWPRPSTIPMRVRSSSPGIADLPSGS
jgi:histidinol dehydrogenase